MLSRILKRLAVVWIIGWVAYILLGIVVFHVTLAKSDAVQIPLVVLVPAAMAYALAWVFETRR